MKDKADNMMKSIKNENGESYQEVKYKAEENIDYGVSHMDEEYPSTGHRLLSLDGGGVRGLSSLYILQHLMYTIKPSNPPKPCDVFDMIAGTSTGGLIAIMLGHFGMTVDECIEAYNVLSKYVFEPYYWPISFLSWPFKIQAKYSSHQLEEVIKKLVKYKWGDEDAPLNEGNGRPKCKVFVCTMNAETSRTTQFRNYSTPHDFYDGIQSVKIWEACRATSAATSFFNPIEINGEMFVDGATGSNNPINEVYDAAMDLWSAESQVQMNQNLRCIVSIGTGIPPTEQRFNPNISEFITSLVNIATETEETAKKFQKCNRDLVTQGKYFRFNVPNIGNIELDEHTKMKAIRRMTKAYLTDRSTKIELGKCAEKLEIRKTFVERDTSEVSLLDEDLDSLLRPRSWRFRVRSTYRSVRSLVSRFLLLGILALIISYTYHIAHSEAPKQQRPNFDAPIFAVLGRTGVGKSSFIDLLGGVDIYTGQRPTVRDTLKSVTTSLSWYEACVDKKRVLLIDTPGFDDSELSDTEVLRMIGEGLADFYQNNDKLIRGVIYLYDISQYRLGGINKKNFAALQKLVGYRNLNNVVLVTTRWLRSPSQEEAQLELRRLEELKKGYWAELIAAGSTHLVHINTPDSASLIIQTLLKKPNILLETQREIVKEHMSWEETEAGKVAEAWDEPSSFKNTSKYLSMNPSRNRTWISFGNELIASVAVFLFYALLGALFGILLCALVQVFLKGLEFSFETLEEPLETLGETLESLLGNLLSSVVSLGLFLCLLAFGMAALTAFVMSLAKAFCKEGALIAYIFMFTVALSFTFHEDKGPLIAYTFTLVAALLFLFRVEEIRSAVLVKLTGKEE